MRIPLDKNLFLGAISGAVVFLSVIQPPSVFGQTPNPVVITWQANNYFPADYAGRASVTPGTLVIASAEVIANNKFLDLSNADIGWYLDNDFLSGGAGMKTASFSARQNENGFQTARVSVRSGDASFDGSLQIPVVRPEVVIDFPSPDKTARAGNQINLTAIPFFFNANSLGDLSFDWLVNDQRIEGGSGISVNVGTPKSQFQKSIPVSVTVQNSQNPYEFGRGFVNLLVTQP